MYSFPIPVPRPPKDLNPWLRPGTRSMVWTNRLGWCFSNHLGENADSVCVHPDMVCTQHF